MNQPASNVSALGCCLLIPFLAVWLVAVRLSMAGKARDESVEEWAKGEGYLLTQCARRAFFLGPFYFPVSRQHTVYRVTVLDADNRKHMGWVRIVEFFWRKGGRVDVRWDEVEPEAHTEVPPPTPDDGRMWDRELDA